MNLTTWQVGHFETALKRLYDGEAIRLIGLDETWLPVVSRDYVRENQFDRSRVVDNVWYAVNTDGGRVPPTGMIRDLLDGHPLFESIRPVQARELLRGLLQPNP